MANNGDIESERPTRHRSTSDCKPLIEAATKELFRNNAFRITGLPVDSTAREIGKHADKLKMMEELGHGASAHTAAFALKPPPTIDQIRDAIQKLKDPEMRLVDEFFWFWPEEFGKSASDPAIQALVAGDGETAMKIWASKETNPTDGVVAMHNVAVLWHLTALEWENYTSRGELDKDRQEKIENYWRNAFKRWERLAVDDFLWEKVNARIRQIDDARLTTGFVRRMRASLPYALDKINAGLALHYAEAKQMDLARVHIQFIRNKNQNSDNLEKVTELVLAPATARVREQIQRAKQAADQNPGTADQAARNLIELALPLVEIFNLFFGKENELRNDIFDEVAATCNRIQVAYHKATNDENTSLAILNSVLPLATSSELKQQIEENIKTLKNFLDRKRYEPIYALLKGIQASTSTPYMKLQEFRQIVIPAMMKATKVSGVSVSFGPLVSDSENSTEVLDSAAVVLRDISLDAWNKHQDKATAIEANKLALEYASNPELRKRISDDQLTLRQMSSHQNSRTSERSAKSPSRPASNLEILKQNKGLLIVGGIILVVIIANLKSCDSPSFYNSTPTTPAPSQPTYNPPVFSGTPDSSSKPTYRVPSSASAELDRDSRAIDDEKAKAEKLASRLSEYKTEVESEKTKADDLETRLKSLGGQVDRAKIYLDQTSQFDVDDFNLKVNRYNAMLRDVRAENEVVNQMVDSYNALLEQVRAQNRVVNQMVDSYNEKLRRDGR